MMNLKGMIVALAATILVACGVPGSVGTNPLPNPVELADRTKVDEQAALTVNLAYTAAAKAAALAIRTGIVSDTATIKRIGELDMKAKAAVDAVNYAYRTANADGYAVAVGRAQSAVSELLSVIK